MDKELSKKKISEKNKAKKQYLEKIELLKQSYGVEFNITNFKDNNIDKIKFYNMKYKKDLKNVTIIYDNKLRLFNYLSYDYSNEKDIKTIPCYMILKEINKEKKIKLVVDEILKYNSEYQMKLEEIDRKYSINNELYIEDSRELEMDRKDKKD